MRNRAGWIQVAELAVVIGFLYAPPSSAGVNTWSTGGPNVLSTSSSSLAIARSDPGVLYLGSGSGLFKSIDAGVTWTSLPNPDGFGIVTSVTIHPSNANTAHVIIDHQIYRTVDGGGTWSARPIPIDSTSVAYVESLSLDPSSPSTLFAGTGDGLYKSTDEGLTWTKGSGVTGDVEAVLSHPARPSTLFAVMRGTLLLKSEDGGATWKLTADLVAAGHTGPIISSIIGDPNVGDTIYVTTDQGFFRTTDGANTWTPLGIDLQVDASSAVAIDPSDSSKIYLARTGSGLYRSTDRGASWTLSQTGLPQSSLGSLVIDPRHTATLFASTPDGVFASFDSGSTWTTSSAGIRGAVIESLAINPVQSSVAYAGTDHGLFRTRNGGRSWNASGLAGHIIFDLAVNPTDPSNLFAATDSFVYRSVDGGETWLAANAGFAPNPYFGGSFVVSLAMDQKTPTTLYASATDALYKSTDSGGRWVRTGLADEIFALAIDPMNPSVIYAGTEADYSYGGAVGFFDLLVKSTDGGTSWSKSQKGLPTGDAIVRAIAIDPSNASVLYAGTDAGLYRSTDAGANWTLTGSELATISVSSLAVDLVKTSTLYAGTSQGVFRSADRGATWQAFNQGLSATPVNSLALDKTGRFLYAGTPGAGTFDYEFPSGPVDLTVAAGGETRLLSVDARDQHLDLDNLNGSGAITRAGPYGPYSGWVPGNIATGPDGLTRILWNNDDGSAALWLLGPEGNVLSYRLDAEPGGRAIDVTSAASGRSHVLWVFGDGRVALSTIDKSGHVSTSPTFGPYGDWEAVAAADSTDGLTRILWNKPDGSTGLSFFTPSGVLASYRYAGASGWSTADLTVGIDGQSRILWSQDDGRIALWSIDNSGTPTVKGPVYTAPEGFTARHVAAGPDGLTRILWTDGSGSALVWIMSADNVYQQSLPVNAN